MSPSEEEYEAAKAALVEAGFTESQVSRILNKPKRAYTKDSNWKEEAKAIYAETGVITRSQIMLTKGFPKSSNPSQTVKRFIGWLQKQTEAELTHSGSSICSSQFLTSSRSSAITPIFSSFTSSKLSARSCAPLGCSRTISMRPIARRVRVCVELKRPSSTVLRLASVLLAASQRLREMSRRG